MISPTQSNKYAVVMCVNNHNQGDDLGLKLTESLWEV